MNQLEIGILRQLIRLEPETGRLYWLHRDPKFFPSSKYGSSEAVAAGWNRKFAGKEALTADRDGYRSGTIFGRTFAAHRVVFVLFYGYWPDGPLDHRDCDHGNNVPSNLRECTVTENNRNVGSKGGSSRFCGVSWHKGGKKWMARCAEQYLGLFDDEVEAARAYDEAARLAHGDFARLNLSEMAA